jgi:TPR repeat protein
MRKKKNDYYWGLIYCTRNDIENAYFYLNRAAKKGNEAAIQTLHELKEKNLLSNYVYVSRSRIIANNLHQIHIYPRLMQCKGGFEC